MNPTIPPPGPADVGIVSALSIEIAPFLAHLERVRKYRGARHTVIEGELGDRLVVVIVTGPGREAARRGAQILIDGHKPSWLVSPGFAGALANDLKRGDLVLPNEIVTEEGGRIAIDIRVTDSGPVPGPRLREGRLITVDRIIRTSRDKAELQERFDADIVDMETFAVAELCASRLVRFLSVRIVSDDAKKDLPAEVLTVLGQSGGYRVGAAMGAIWRRPSSFLDLLQLREQANDAARRLARFLLPVVKELD